MANITLDKLKTIVQSIVASVTRYKPNMSVNDPDDPRYVAGRLCYKTDPVEKTLADNEIIETAENYTESVWSFLLEEGQSYTVVWDGVTYADVCSEYDDGYGVGNTSLYSDDATDTGEPFYIETYGGATGVYVAETGSHTVTIVATEQKVVQLPKEYLPPILASELPEIPVEKIPDLGLANVAFSGSYNDLIDVPDVLTPANTAVVARTGNYNDLSNTPCKETTSSSAHTNINHFNSYLPDIAPSGNEFIQSRDEYAWGRVSSGAVVSFCAYRTTNLVFIGEYTSCQEIDSKLFWGNASLYNTEYPDTGEEWCVWTLKQSGTYAIYVYSSGKTMTSLQYSIRTTTVDPLDVKFIPSTIQRAGEPLYLTDSDGAKWQLVVGTDGTLSTTAVTE